MNDLIDGWFDGTLDATQLAALDERLQHDTAFAQAFAERGRLHWLLAVHRRGGRGSAVIARRRAHIPHRRASSRTLGWLATAAALLVMGIWWWTAVGGTADATWTIVAGSAGNNGRVLGSGQHLPHGRLQARAELRLAWSDGHTTAEVAAGSTFTLGTPDARLALVEGRMALTVAPQPADAPLVVGTPHGLITVLGTRFTVHATPAWSEVTVAAGRVRVIAEGRPPREVSATGRALLGVVPRITGFTLIDATTGAAIRPLTDGAVLTLSRLPPHLNIRAETAGPVGSVALRLDGASLQRNQRGVENTPPFTLTGNNDEAGRIHPWTPRPGRQRLTAIPYAADDGNGLAGEEIAIGIEIVAP